MSEITLNGNPVSSAVVCMPRHGAWVAKVTCASEATITGACTLNCNGVVFRGTVKRGVPWQGSYACTIAGGAGNLNATVQPKFFQDVPAYLLLKDVLGAQALSATCNQAMMNVKLAKWVRPGWAVSDEVASITMELGAAWRILADGTLWVGEDAYPASSIAGSVLSLDQGLGKLKVALAKATLTPGVTWQGYRLSYVQHQFSPSSFTTECWYE